jgi:hypothetical protein
LEIETTAFKIKRQLSMNVTSAMRVAGPDKQGKPSKLTTMAVLRSTGMSRSTLRPVIDKDGSSTRGADLNTLQKLAKALGIPLPFLLMAPEDWQALVKAIRSIDDHQVAAQIVVSDPVGSPAQAVAVLRRCKVHPDIAPLGVPVDPAEKKRLDARNEWRRRSSMVLAALAQPAARLDANSLVELTALAAALANVMTPHSPELEATI